jgi:single-strand DNA-binding protein
MSSFNKVILVGRVTRDPELRYTPNGRPVAQFGLAVDRPRSSSGGDKETDFFDVVVWQQTAEFAAKYATKGRLVLIDGRLQVRSYETQEGQKRKSYEIVGNDLRLLDRKETSSAPPSEQSYDAPRRETTPSVAANVDRGPQDMGIDEIPF